MKRNISILIILGVICVAFFGCIQSTSISTATSNVFNATMIPSLEPSSTDEILTTGTQTTTAEPEFPMIMREMTFVENNDICQSIPFEDFSFDGDLLIRTMHVGYDEINYMHESLGSSENFFTIENTLDGMWTTSDGVWVVALTQYPAESVNQLLPDRWYLINVKTGETYTSEFGDVNIFQTAWEIRSFDQDSVQMLIFPRSSNMDRYFSELQILELPSGNYENAGFDTDTADIEYPGKWNPNISFSEDYRYVIYFTHGVSWDNVHTIMDIQTNTIVWQAPRSPSWVIEDALWEWAPGKNVIAFTWNNPNNSDFAWQGELFLLDLDNRTWELVSQFSRGEENEYYVDPICWSKDGDKLLVDFIGFEGSDIEEGVYIFDFEKNLIIQGCDERGRVKNAFWSDDGSEVMFTISDNNYDSVVLMDANTGNAESSQYPNNLDILFWDQSTISTYD